MLKSFVYDQTGLDSDESRCTILTRLLGKLDIQATILQGSIVATPGDEILVLAHLSDLSDARDTELQRLAKQGAVVVRYTAGGVQERIDHCEKGFSLTLSWQAVKQVLLEVPAHPDLVTFLHAVEAIRKRSVLNALAILSWCVTCSAEDMGIRQRQKDWKTDRRKWLDVFNSATKEDVMKACGVTPGSEFPQQLEEIGNFLTWLWPDSDSTHTPEAPDFENILSELESRYGMRA